MMKAPASIALLLMLPLAAQAAPKKLRYNRDIRPILSDNCFFCHGPDKNHREADLRLDVREEAVKAGAITPGDPAKSSLVDRILTHDEEDLMPPEESKKTLSDSQKNLLKQWIIEGAEYEEHWAYTPLVKPALPARDGNVSPIDIFIEKELAEHAIKPSPEADRRTLIRRLSLDLTGLPPSPQEVEAFVKDVAPEAYERLVERLLKSPRFGERWAVWWLDAVRFADTVGFHGDQNQRIFPYRDYVINAFNSNKRFNQFTVEQIAGDLLPNPTTEQLVATGFNRLNMMTREGGAQPKEYLAKYQADRVRTVGSAWLGATMGCSECHDHKFDPITQKDFYSLSAYFGDVKQFGVYADYGYTPNPELKGWSNDHPFPPEILVDSPYLKQRQKRLEKEMADLALGSLAKADRAAFLAWSDDMQAFLKANPGGWSTPVPAVTTATDATPPKKGEKKTAPKKPAAPDTAKAEVRPDGRILITAKSAQKTDITFNSNVTHVAAVKVELLPDAAHKGSVELNGKDNGMTILPKFSVRRVGAAKDETVAVYHADAHASVKKPRFSGTHEEAGVKTGWSTVPGRSREAQSSVWLLDRTVELKEGDVFHVRLNNHSAGCLRVSLAAIAPVRPLAKDWPASISEALSKKDATNAALAQAWLVQKSGDKAAKDHWMKLHASVLECNDGKAWTQVTVPVKEPLPIRVLPRGNWQDESGELVMPASLHFVPSRPVEKPRQDRLDLAKWLCSQENPLTARAVANRVWKPFFGNALSAVVDDLGMQGETPSHPELLDWLAADFRDSGWDFKKLVKTIVMSRTYRLDSRARPELREIDPANRLLSFQNPRRLEAEFVRDNALSISGILNGDIGGPSAKPYQPPGYYENLQFPSREYTADVDDRQYRRGLYMHWQRTFLHPMLANFDAPSRDEAACTRTVSNTPQQALTLLNDPTFVEAAKMLAADAVVSSKDDKVRIRNLYLKALGREAKEREVNSLLAFLNSQRNAFKDKADDAAKLLTTGLKPPPQGDPVELAAWTSLCRVVLNLHETITRY